MKDKLITIIGGSGFVGTNICKLLASEDLPFEIIDLNPSFLASFILTSG